ncbi:MAG: TolC family protein, partial [Pseudomonadota bacterium]|nr:TolC family protein [Pseudomonadota bacterium]
LPVDIVVLLKAVPAVGNERLDDRFKTQRTGALESNGNDEYVLEAALKLIEAHGGEVTLLSMGPPGAADALRKALAMGATRAVHVVDEAIAWSDVRALEQQLEAIEAAYIASRRSRDVIAERFRAARGTLFDVVAAEDAYFEAATSYIQSLTELDAARYILLSRTGRLLEVLRIDADQLRGESER